MKIKSNSIQEFIICRNSPGYFLDFFYELSLFKSDFCWSLESIVNFC